MKNILTAALLFAGAQTLWAQQTNYSSLKISPEEPQPGSTIEITYDPAGTPLEKMKSPIAGVYVLNKSLPQAIEIPFKKSGKAFTASYTIPDTATGLLIRPFVDETADANDKKGYVFMVYEKEGTPLREAYKSMAMLYNSYGSIAGLDRNEAKAEYFNKKYYDGVQPGQMKSFSEKYDYYTAVKDTVALLQLFGGILSDTSATEANFMVAAGTAGRFKQKEMATLLTDAQKLKFPNGSMAKRAVYNDYNKAKTVAEKKAVIEKFLAEYDDEEARTMAASMRGAMSSLLLKEEGFDAAVASIAPNTKGSNLAATYNSIAWQSAEADKDIEKAMELSAKSLALLEEEMKQMENKPPYYTPTQYKQNLTGSYGMYSDTYAFLLYKQGNHKEALKYAEKAVANSKNPELMERYAMILEKASGAPKAKKYIEETIRSGKYTAAMKEQLKSIYEASGKDGFDNYFNDLYAEARKKMRAEVEKKMINEAAPTFALKDMNGNDVSLASLKGKVAVIDFWATWCGPCIASFPAMNKAQNNHKSQDDIVFLFVNTWENNVDDKKKNVADFMKGKPYAFDNILLDTEDKMITAYKVSGIPTKFILDREGKIRFKSVGFGGQEDAAVEELGMMIEIAGKL